MSFINSLPRRYITFKSFYSSPLFQLKRSFSTTPSLLAKKSKKENKKESKKSSKKDSSSKNDDSEIDEVLDPKAIISDLTSKYDNTLSQFNKKLTEIKMGRANPSIFDNLKIKIDDNYTANFPEIAMTAMKGTNFLNVTVFDPNHRKRIISAILESNMNLNPEIDPKNDQLLKIKLPNTTKDLKAKQIKQMKELLDQYKSNLNFKNSLQSIRSVLMKDLKNVEGSKDIVRKLSNDIDSTYKSYSEKLSSSFKTFEKSLN